MLEMKLPMKTAEEGGDDTAEDEQEQTDYNLHIPTSVSQTASNRFAASPRGLGYPLDLDKETVFEWFGLYLSPSKRIELMCGLLHMCQPLELRFLGSCLENLARKDFHILRDSEIRANNPNDLGLLTDVSDPVIRSKLLVCLSLLGSENRECAGILFRILSHVDSALYFKNYGFAVSSCTDPQHFQIHPSCVDGQQMGGSAQGCGPPVEAGAGPLEQLALLFTMASLHPAFPFHQRETVRVQLEKVEAAIEEERQHYQHSSNAMQRKVPKNDYLSPSTESSLFDRAQSPHGNQPVSRKTQREAVHIEKIVLKGAQRSRTDRCLEYTFEVKWSDSSSSCVMKTSQELEDFLFKLPKEQSTESFEKGILRLLNKGDELESRELEQTLREKFLSAPQAFRRIEKVCSFFLSDSSTPSCSHCNLQPPGKPFKTNEHFKEDCSEASSQEEDLEPYVVGPRKKHGSSSKSPSLSIPGAKCSQAEVRRTPHLELNGVADWRKKSCVLKTSLEPCTRAPEQHLSDENRSMHSGSKKKIRSPADREKGKKSDNRISYITNGVMRQPPEQLIRPATGKDLRLDPGSGQDTCGETSSECYSSPSSPRHDGRESLESEDEKDKDTDSNSDDSSKDKADSFLSPKSAVGAAVATVRPLLPVMLKDGVARPESPLSASKFTQLSFMHPMQYVVQNGATKTEGAVPQQILDGKTAGGLIMPATMDLPSPVAVGESEKQLLEPVPLPPPFNPSPLGLPPQPSTLALQPLIQRFKTGAPQAASESSSASPHQPPVGAISMISPGPSYVSPHQPTYPNTEPALGSGLPLAEPHTKPPGVPLPSGLPPSFSLSVPSSMLPSPVTTGTPAVGQVKTMVPAAVPTHTPGPAPSPSPALTHSTAQSDSTSYINSTSCGSSSGVSQQQQQQQQQQPPTPQQLSCGACGCRGSCGSSHVHNFFFPPHLPCQVFSVPPFFHVTSLCNSSYLNQAHQSNGATQLPFFPPAPSPYPSGPLMHTHSDHVLGTQAGYGLQQMAAFSRFYSPVYPSVSMVPGTNNGVGMKKNGNISCYNCGVSGHYAQDCKQPSIDASQQVYVACEEVTSRPRCILPCARYLPG
nr:PREDICTED: zinc finger CCHC domain-containing protein 2 isoform X1 [Lepisosteus oculatus]